MKQLIQTVNHMKGKISGQSIEVVASSPPDYIVNYEIDGLIPR